MSENDSSIMRRLRRLANALDAKTWAMLQDVFKDPDDTAEDDDLPEPGGASTAAMDSASRARRQRRRETASERVAGFEAAHGLPHRSVRVLEGN